MQFTLLFSALAAVALAAPAADCNAAPAPAPAAPAVQKCTWDVHGVTATLSAGDSITLNGVDIACGTTGAQVRTPVLPLSKEIHAD